MTTTKIRSATYSDIIPVWGMMQEAHARSDLAGVEMNEKLAKALLTQSVQRHGGQSAGSTFFAVAEGTDRLHGFIIGLLSHLYHVLMALEATDLYWYASPGADPTAGRRLLRSMHKWAWASPHVSVIRQANTNSIVEADRSGALLGRQGMRQTGCVYQKDRDQ